MKTIGLSAWDVALQYHRCEQVLRGTLWQEERSWGSPVIGPGSRDLMNRGVSRSGWVSLSSSNDEISPDLGVAGRQTCPLWHGLRLNKGRRTGLRAI